MAIDALAFCFGGLLLFVALLGGGFEVKELKVPRLTWVPRTVFGSLGAIFILIGLGRQPPTNEHHEEQISPVQNAPPSTNWVPGPAPIPVKFDNTVGPTEAQLTGGFSGLHGTALVRWSAGEFQYVAQLQLQGQVGLAAVQFASATVRGAAKEDLVLQATSSGWLYMGSNVRDPSDNRSLEDGEYSPDSFRLLQTSAGSWTVSDMCDNQGICSPVQVQPVE